MSDLTSRWSALYAGDCQHTLLNRKRVQLTELLASVDNDEELALLNYMATKGKEQLQPITDSLLEGLEEDERQLSLISRDIQTEAHENLLQLHLELKTQHETLGAEHQELGRKFTALESENQGLEIEHRKLGEEHQAAVAENAPLRDFERRFNALSLQQASLEGRVRTETDEANLREFEMLKGEHHTLKDQHKNVEEKNERLKTQLRGLGAVEEENERLKTQMRGLKDKLRDEVENHDVLKNTNSRTNVALRTAEEDLKGLKKKCNDLEEIAADANSWKDKYNNAKRNLEDVTEKAWDWERKHGELSVELQTSNSSTQDWERKHGELSAELQASKSSAQDWEKKHGALSVELQASNASVRSLTYQAAYTDATFRNLREEDARDLTLLHSHNSIVERHTKEIHRLGLELRADRQCLDHLFTQLAEHRQAATGKHKTFAKAGDASFVKATGIFRAELKALHDELVGALRQRGQLLARLDNALDEAVQASSITSVAEQNARGDLETRLKAVLAHSETKFGALNNENVREHNRHLTTLQEMHACINPEQPWQIIEIDCSHDEYEAQTTARLEALKNRVYDVGDMVHELQKQEGRRLWAENARLLYDRVVELESNMRDMGEIVEEKDRLLEVLSAQMRRMRGFLVTLGLWEEDGGGGEEDGGDGEEDGGDGEEDFIDTV